MSLPRSRSTPLSLYVLLTNTSPHLPRRLGSLPEKVGFCSLNKHHSLHINTLRHRWSGTIPATFVSPVILSWVHLFSPLFPAISDKLRQIINLNSTVTSLESKTSNELIILRELTRVFSGNRWVLPKVLYFENKWHFSCACSASFWHSYLWLACFLLIVIFMLKGLFACNVCLIICDYDV